MFAIVCLIICVAESSDTKLENLMSARKKFYQDSLQLFGNAYDDFRKSTKQLFKTKPFVIKKPSLKMFKPEELD